jgi:outer membrane protein assembly factor BamB
VDDTARTAVTPPVRESYPDEDQIPAGDPATETSAFAAADPQSAGGTPFPLGTGFGENDFVLTGRRQRQQQEPGLRDALLSWSSEVLDGLGQTGRAAGRESDRFLLRRALVWASLGAASILVLAILILIGRLLMGPRPEGPEVSPGLDLTSGMPAVVSEEAGQGKDKTDAAAEPPPAFTGASWTRRFPQAISSSPLILDQQLIVGCRNGNLYAVALADGKERWRLPVGTGVGSSPVAAGSMVVVGSYSGDVVAAEAETGRERWRTTTGGKIVSSPAFFPRGELVIIGSHDCHVYGLAADDGTMRWKTLTGGIIWASPTLAKDRIVVGSHDGALYCLDAASGRIEWRAATGAPISSTAAIWRDRAAVVGSGDGKIHAFRLTDGKPLWSQRAGSPVGGTLAVSGDLVLAGTDGGELLALAGEDGAIRYRVRTRGAVKSRPAVNQEQIWFTSYDGRLRVVDLASGKDLWSFPASGALYSSPAVLGRTAFFGSMNGTLYAATWTGNPVAAKL